ncbi:hypothetical protein O0L34_g17131 [Tuta absoluta]|nr:hypothetical protein O0L34_g17131 [Tuta absoluta]
MEVICNVLFAGILSRLLGHTIPKSLSVTKEPPSGLKKTQEVGSLFENTTQKTGDVSVDSQNFSSYVPGINLPPGLSVIPTSSSSQLIPAEPGNTIFNQDLSTMSDVASPQDTGFHFLSGFSVIPDSLLKQELSVAGDMPPPQVAGVENSLPELVELSGPKFTTSQRGHVVIHWGNYRYNRHSKYKKAKVLWRCCRWSAGCRASLYSYNDQIINKKNEHNHV